MKCPYCDQEHPDDTLYCPNTGKMLSEVEQNTGNTDQAPGVMPPSAPGMPIEQGPAPREEPVDHERPPQEQTAVQAISLSQVETMMVDTAAPEPVPSSPGTVPASPTVMPASPKKRHTARWVVGGCVGIPLVILLLLVIVALVDPFNLHLWGRVNGSYDAAAEVMPADTGAYLGINIGNLMLTPMDRVITPFIPSEEASKSSTRLDILPANTYPQLLTQTNPYEELLGAILEDTGMTLEDITPWIGQYAGIGIVEFEDTEYGGVLPSGWLLAVEVRNFSKADTFIERLLSNMQQSQYLDYEPQTYGSLTIYVQKAGTLETAAYCRSGRMLFVASSLDVVKEAINQQASLALPSRSDYADLIAQRPRDWSASLYFNKSIMGSFGDNMLGAPAAAMPLVNPYPSTNWTGMLMSVSAISQGARIDMYVNFDDSNGDVSNSETTKIAIAAPQQVIGMLPQDTLIYLSNPDFGMMIDAFMSSAFSDDQERSYFFEGVDQSLGFSLQDDLLDHLTGEWALYAVPSTRGLLHDELDVDLALNLIVQTDAGFSLKPVTEGINRHSIFDGINLVSQDRQGVTYYELNVFGTESPMLAFGSNNGYFTLGTDIDALQINPGGEDLLVNSTNYQTALHTLPAGMQPSIYVDLESLFANLREGMDSYERESFDDSIAALEPIRMIAGANRMLSDNIAHSSIVVIISSK